METHEIRYESGAVVRVQGEDWLECVRKARALAPATKTERIVFSDQYDPAVDDRGPLDRVEIRDEDGRVTDIITTGRTLDRRTVVTAIVTVAAFLAGAGADQIIDNLP
jgi:hypothetical protein